MKKLLSRYLTRTGRFPGIALRDRRRFLTVRMDTTNHCNLRCSMCPMRLADSDPGREWRHISDHLFRKIVRQVFPLAGTVGLSCGAEPFCNPGIGGCLKALFDSGVPGRELVTNGTLLNPGNAALLVRYPPTTLFVSIDGARPETHSAIRGGADLDLVVSNLMELSRIRGRRRYPMIALSTTLQRDNLREIPGIVELAARVGACAVGLAPLVPYMGLSTLESVVDPSAPEARVFLDEASTRAQALGVDLSVTGGDKAGGHGNGCPYLESTVYLAPDGAVFPCPYWNTGNPIGDLTREDFGAVWDRRHRYLSDDTCGNCPELTSGSREVRKDH